MGTLTGQAIVDRAWFKLQDKGATPGIRWTSAECLLWVNDAQRAIVNLKPSANVVAAITTLAAGTRQSLPALGLAGAQLHRLTRNFAADGVTAGRAITLIPVERLDETRPNWHAETGPAVKHFVVDDRDPKAFYVYPARPPAGTGRVEVVYTAIPADLANLNQSIVLDDLLAEAMQFYVLFSAYGKDSTYSKSSGNAAGYYQLFLQSLGLGAQAQAQAAPTTEDQK